LNCSQRAGIGRYFANRIMCCLMDMISKVPLSNLLLRADKIYLIDDTLPLQCSRRPICRRTCPALVKPKNRNCPGRSHTLRTFVFPRVAAGVPENGNRFDRRGLDIDGDRNSCARPRPPSVVMLGMATLSCPQAAAKCRPRPPACFKSIVTGSTCRANH